MKQKTILFFILFAVIFTVNAQEHKQKIGLGIRIDYFNVPLNQELFVFNTSGVNAVYFLNKKINVKIAYESNNLMDKNLKRYEQNHGIMFETGYFINKDMSKNFTTELTLSSGTVFNNSFSFNNYYSKTGVNFYLFKAFYLGTGLKYFYLEDTNFNNLPINNFNWYWQMGFQLYLK